MNDRPDTQQPAVALRTIAVALVVIALALSALVGISIYRQAAPASTLTVDPGPRLSGALSDMIYLECVLARATAYLDWSDEACGNAARNWIRWQETHW